MGLTNDTKCDEDELEDGEHAQLEISDTIAELPKREAREQARDDVQHKLVVHVVDIPVNGNGHSFRHELDLGHQVCGEFLTVVMDMCILVPCFLNAVIQIRKHRVVLGRFEPDLVPVLLVRRHNIDHVFSWVYSSRTWSFVLAEVLVQGGSLLSDFAEIGCPTTSGEKEQGVKLVEELSARLMDRDQDSLSGGC